MVAAPGTRQRADLLDGLVAVTAIGLGMLIAVYAPLVLVRAAYGAGAIDDRSGSHRLAGCCCS
jgi:hypothetical protein